MGRELQDMLLQSVRRRTSADGWSWFDGTRRKLSESVTESTLLTAYTAATRRLGNLPLNIDSNEAAELCTYSKIFLPDRWRVNDVARAIFLLTIVESAESSFHPLVTACYEMGDSSEQASWLRGLILLPECDRFLATAIDSCRTNIVPLFESIACENPYPCLYFPELNFNQMVMKSLFNGIRLSRIVGLESRLNDELRRMADDYASERRAAGREVPSDIHLAKGLKYS